MSNTPATPAASETATPASSSVPASNGESQDSIYARNKAIYEASLAAQQQQQEAGASGTNGVVNGSSDANGHSNTRKRSQSPNKPDTPSAEDGQPARKKLVRAGEMSARNGSADGKPSTPSAGSPPASASVPMSDAEMALQVNAQAFCAKNPGVPFPIVQQALRHSRGVFDINFSNALRMLLNQAKTSAGSPNGQFSPPAHAPTSLPPGQPQPPPFVPQPQAGSPTAEQQQPQQPMMARYPGQNMAMQASRPYPGSAAYKTAQQQGAAVQPNPMSPTGGVKPTPSPGLGGPQSINGQSAASLPQVPQMRHPPPPIPTGTHPAIGFSALQVLPVQQHQQFMALAPQQQIDYSMQVWNSLVPEQRQQFSMQWQAQQRLRDAWNMQQAANGGVIMGQQGKSINPYVGYAGHTPTHQQQMQQTRFPGQNPVFRVGAPGPGMQTIAPPSNAAQQQYLAEQFGLLVSQLSPEARNQVLSLPDNEKMSWTYTQVQLRMEHQKRQAQQQARQQQQQVMAKSHQQHKQAKAAAASAPKKKKKSRTFGGEDSEDEDDPQVSDDDDDDEDADGGFVSEGEAEREEKAIEWFNTTTKQELIEMTGIKPEQADAVFEMRPYTSPGEIRAKLRKRKGVSGQLFDNYVDLMYSYAQTDECLAKCAGIGKELESILSIWTGGKHVDVTESMRPSVEPEEARVNIKVEGQAESEEKPDIKVDNSSDTLQVPSATPAATLSAEQTANVGTPLIEMNDDVLEHSKDENVAKEVREAFDGYLYEQPKLLAENVKLKKYQLLGVNWIRMLYKKNISCILADEMGLGKTIQVIAFLAHLKETKQPGPHLIVVPSSTLDNWLREFEKFAPGLTVYAYYGSQAEREDARFYLKEQKDKEDGPGLDVIVTTYNMATGQAEDKKFLRKMDFKACVFDEGHQLKNGGSKKYRDLMEIRVGWRLLLTGTPLQNNLQELVSLLSFILPKIFLEAQESLRAIFKVPPDAHKNLLTRQRVRAAKQVMTPFVLRRKKAQVLRDLPAKKEIVEYCDMTEIQRDIYRETLAKHKKAVIDYQASGTNTPAEEAKPAPKKRGRASAKTGKEVQESSTSNVLMALRKAANHPMLFRRLYDDATIKAMAKDCLKEEEFVDRNVDYIYEDMDLMTDFELNRFVQPYKHLNKYALKNEEWMDAGKVKKLIELLPEIKARGDRVLIFSQFVQVLDILAVVLDTMNMRHITLTGQTNVNDRQNLVDEFTEDPEITCFLLSTRAGGLGLNLVAANVVIIMDMDFNPHNDKQAGDRAYRIGQTKEVTIYKLVTRNTIEEDMLALADTKLALDEQVSAESAVTGAAATAELDEVQETVVEKKVKSSLMQTLQKRFEGSEAGPDGLPKLEIEEVKVE